MPDDQYGDLEILHQGLARELLRVVTVVGFLGRADGVVPLRMESVSGERYGGELGVADFDSCRLVALVEFGANLEASPGGGGGDELHDDFVAGLLR